MAANGDVVFTTVFADGLVWFRVLTAGAYTPWRSAGGKATSGVGTAPEPGTSRVLITVRGTDGATWVHALAPGETWRTGRWSTLGGRTLAGGSWGAWRRI